MGRLRQGRGEGRGEATVAAEGRSVRLEQQGSRQGQTPGRQF